MTDDEPRAYNPPTPRDLQRRLAGMSGTRQKRTIDPDWKLALQETFAAADLHSKKVGDSKTSRTHSAVKHACLLAETISGTEVAKAWAETLRADLYVTAAEGLLFDFYASILPQEFADGLPKGYGYIKTLHTIRMRTSVALHDYARDINWRRPILFVSVLALARRYHRVIVHNEQLTREDQRQQFTGRLGVATVLISRYEDLDAEDLLEAYTALRESLSQGNDRDSAVPYLLEAASRCCDIGADVAPRLELEEWVEFAEREFTSSPESALAAIELILKLEYLERLAPLSLNTLARCRDLLTSCRGRFADAESKVRWIILDLVVAALQDGRLAADAVIGLRVPFGFRRGAVPENLSVLIEPLIRALSPMAHTGEPLARGIYSDLVELLEVPPTKLPAKLSLMIQMRGDDRGWKALEDERSRLLVQRDRLGLAATTGDLSVRRKALHELIQLTESKSCDVAAIVLIAKDLESNSACPSFATARTDPAQGPLAAKVNIGDARYLLEEAARRALGSPDLSVAPLGGRSGVVTVGDYFDVVGGTFVFKKATVLTWKREVNRSRALQTSIQRAGLSSKFGVVDHLSPRL